MQSVSKLFDLLYYVPLLAITSLSHSCRLISAFINFFWGAYMPALRNDSTHLELLAFCNIEFKWNGIRNYIAWEMMLRTKKDRKRYRQYVSLTENWFYFYFFKNHLPDEGLGFTPHGSMAKTEAKSLHSVSYMLSLWCTFLCTLFWVPVFSLVYEEWRLYKDKNGSTLEDYYTENCSAFVNLVP